MPGVIECVPLTQVDKQNPGCEAVWAEMWVRSGCGCGRDVGAAEEGRLRLDRGYRAGDPPERISVLDVVLGWAEHEKVLQEGLRVAGPVECHDLLPAAPSHQYAREREGVAAQDGGGLAGTE